MGRPKRTTQAQKLLGELQLARIQVTKAESKLAAAKERARLAKRRRREAKLEARRTKKAVKRAKAELCELKEAMAEAEAKLAQAGIREVRKRMRAGNPAQVKRPGSKRRKRAVAIWQDQLLPASTASLAEDSQVAAGPEKARPISRGTKGKPRQSGDAVFG